MRFDMGYEGPERRIHRILVTRNTEYHMRRRTCVRVRDRQSGRWLDEHRVTNLMMSGCFAFGFDGGDVNLSDIPDLGECVFFNDNGIDIITSPVLSVERSPKEIVRQQYPPTMDEYC